MKHHYLISYDDTTQVWDFEHELESELLTGGTVWDDSTDKWSRNYFGADGLVPNAAEADKVIGAALAQLSTGSAPDAIAPRALSVSESPALTASAVAPLRSAVTTFNNCEGGEPLGFAVWCSDMSGQWIESGFTDEAGAERFAEHFTMYDSDTSASVGLLITDDRSLWDDVENRGGADCVIVWNDTREEVAVFISFEPSDEDTPRDEGTFYYATHEEWEDLAQGNDHHDGWYIQEITNYTTKETTK